jgi:hypothetical protein
MLVHERWQRSSIFSRVGQLRLEHERLTAGEGIQTLSSGNDETHCSASFAIELASQSFGITNYQISAAQLSLKSQSYGSLAVGSNVQSYCRKHVRTVESSNVECSSTVRSDASSDVISMATNFITAASLLNYTGILSQLHHNNK